MILATDVDYRDKYAVVAGILFEKWESHKPAQEICLKVNEINDYIPGQFYKRELPCIKVLLDSMENIEINFIVIDGYVYLGANKKPGLGWHVWNIIDGRFPVIGVAKSAFKDTPKNTELLRGKSKRPLYITSEGIETEIAKQYIKNMHGEHRIPTLLKKVDKLCRTP